MSAFQPDLDPYGELEYVIGSSDDFVCFDFDIDRENKVVHIASTVNSETGSFIDRFRDTVAVPYGDNVLAPYHAARGLMDDAVQWCFDNEVEHDAEGWNQDPEFFARAVHAAVTGTGPAIRTAVAMAPRPINTRNYL